MTRLLPIASVLFVFARLTARATLLGLDGDPMGAAWNRGDASSGFAVWDAFPGTQFSNLAPSSTGGITNPLSHQASEFTVLNQGAGH